MSETSTLQGGEYSSAGCVNSIYRRSIMPAYTLRHCQYVAPLSCSYDKKRKLCRILQLEFTTALQKFDLYSIGLALSFKKRKKKNCEKSI